MKRMQLIAVALCLIMITTVGAGVVAAKQQENPRQAGSSSIYFYDVAPADGHGKGKLQINVEKHTFVFNGQGFEPSVQIALQARAAGSSDYKVFATGKATPSGNLHIAGTWEAAAAPDDVVGATIYMGTLQRPTTYYPDYTLVYTDYAGQKFTIYLPPNTITGGTLPSTFLNPVALDYVYNFDDYHHTVQFVYQGVTYTAQFATTTHAPYLSSDAKYNVFGIGVISDEVFGHVYLNTWDATQNKYVKRAAVGATVDIWVYTTYLGTPQWEHLKTKTTDSDGKFCYTTASFSPPTYRVDFSLSPYPSGSVDAEHSVTPGFC